ncbi:hypothetical protein [Phenylobacterium deserti]|uniref:Peptidase A2 domain-containing protein n=1 Tax=Phenylobacterium deserti TaxID=1914756 RepID=A0A328ATT8_9CAUL|nr:hypothetical protein [Phenylobacterium deserti]RAK57979.1 hypothetical protein DJ018_08745 [Phenylobacterium deserti]
MIRRSIALLTALTAATAAPAIARAGEVRCWLDNGVVVAAASVAGVAGDYVIDTGQAGSQLGETRAQSEGFDGKTVAGEVLLANERLGSHALAVTDLDLRTGALPTPVAGVLGADVLRGFVIDVRFAPCRLAVWPAGKSPPLSGVVHTLEWKSGAPTVAARAADGSQVLEGAFTLATGSDTAVRLSDDAASVARATKRQELYPYGVYRPRLRALELNGRLFELVPAGLLRARDTPALGELGTPVLAHYRLRFDFPASRVVLANEKSPPAAADGP